MEMPHFLFKLLEMDCMAQRNGLGIITTSPLLTLRNNRICLFRAGLQSVVWPHLHSQHILTQYPYSSVIPLKEKTLNGKTDFCPLIPKSFLAQNPEHICLSLQQGRRQKPLRGEQDGLFRAGLFEDRLMCHQIDDGLFVCA